MRKDDKEMRPSVIEEAIWLLILFMFVIAGCYFLMGCSWQGQTAQGIKWTGPWNSCSRAEDPIQCSEDLSTLVQISADTWEDMFGRKIWPHELNQIREIGLYRFNLYCMDPEDPSRKCAGLLLHGDEEGTFRIAVRQSPCLAFTSIIHEFGHYFLILQGENDRDHEREDVFYVAGSFEARAKGAAIQAGLCPDVTIER